MKPAALLTALVLFSGLALGQAATGELGWTVKDARSLNPVPSNASAVNDSGDFVDIPSNVFFHDDSGTSLNSNGNDEVLKSFDASETIYLTQKFNITIDEGGKSGDDEDVDVYINWTHLNDTVFTTENSDTVLIEDIEGWQTGNIELSNPHIAKKIEVIASPKLSGTSSHYPMVDIKGFTERYYWDANYTDWNQNSRPTGEETFFTFDGSKYFPRQYIATVNSSYQFNRTAYLLKLAQGNTYPGVQVVDQVTQEGIENVHVNIRKQIQGVYTTVTQKKTTNAGTAAFFLDPQTIYQVQVSHDSYQGKTVSYDPESHAFSTLLIELEKTNATDTAEDDYFVYNILTDSSCNTDFLINISCTWNSSSNDFQKARLVVKEKKPLGFTNICTNTSTDSAGTLTCRNFNASQVQHRYTLTGEFKNGNIDLESGYLGKVDNPWQDEGIYLVLLIFLTVSAGGWHRPERGIALGILALIGGWITKIFAVSIGGMISLVAVGAILIYRMRGGIR